MTKTLIRIQKERAYPSFCFENKLSSCLNPRQNVKWRWLIQETISKPDSAGVQIMKVHDVEILLIPHYQLFANHFWSNFTYSGEKIPEVSTHQVRRNLNSGHHSARCDPPYRRSGLTDESYRKRCLGTLVLSDWEGAAYHYKLSCQWPRTSIHDPYAHPL